MSVRAKLLLALGALLALALVLLIALRGDSRGSSAVAAPPAARSEPTTESPARTRDEPTPVEASEPDPARRPEPAAAVERRPVARAPAGRVDVQVVWADTLAPCSGIHVVLWPLARGGPYFTEERNTDREGLAHFDGVDAGRVFVFGDRGGQAEIKVERDQLSTVTLELPRGCRVEGRVIAAPGANASQAEVWSFREGRWRRLLECDATHRFVLEGIEPGTFLSARARDWTSSRPMPIDGEEGSTVYVDLTVDARGALILGQVLDPEEHPVAGAVVGVEVSAVQTEAFVIQLGKVYVTTTTDTEGRFAIAGYGKDQRVVVSAAGFAPYETVVDCSVFDERIERIVRLVEGAVVIGRVTDASGHPVAGALVVSGDILEDELFARTATSGADGTYRLTGLAGQKERLQAGFDEPAGGDAETEVELKLGVPTVWNPVVEAPSDDAATSRAK